MSKTHVPFLLMALLGACTQNISTPRPTTALVEEIASDRSDPRNMLLNGFGSPDRNGDIVLVGSERMCAHFSSALMEADMRDNVDAGLRPDGLSDFAGETVTSICDMEPDSTAGVEALRDKVVNLVLAAVDTVYNMARYDMEGQGRKQPAKVVVLCDAAYSVSGRFDVDTLFSLTGCGIPVYSPFESTLHSIIRRTSPVNIAVIGSSADVDAGVYETIAREQFARLRSRNSDIHAFSADSVGVLTALLDEYAAGSGERPLDVLVIDVPGVDVSLIREEAGRILSLMCPESVTYGHLLSRGFSIIPTADVMCSVCYDALRSTNLFTFKIAPPAASGYAAIARPDGMEGGCLVVPQDNYVQDKR